MHTIDAQPYRGRARLTEFLDDPDQRELFNGLALGSGDRLEIVVKLHRPAVYQDPGVFDYRRYLERQGFYWTGTIRNPRLITILDRGWHGPDRIKKWIQGRVEAPFQDVPGGRDIKGLVAGMVLGKTYGLTATVESPYLICASIMSKKLAEGIDGLVLDVKTGSGAFMKTEKESIFLAELMVETGKQMGKKMVALITDMDQPLGWKVGNALEIEECIEVMKGGGPTDLRELCLELAAWMLYLAGRTTSVNHGRELAVEIIRSQSALEKVREIIWLQGGDSSVIDDPARLPQAQHRLPILSPATGFVGAIHCEQVGIASLVLGGGREKKEDAIDPAVGLVLHKKVGDPVHAGEPLCTIRYNSDARLRDVRRLLEQAYRIAEQPPLEVRPLVHRVISGQGAQT